MSNLSSLETSCLVDALHDALELERMLVNSLHASIAMYEKQTTVEKPSCSLHHTETKKIDKNRYIFIEKEKNRQENNKDLHKSFISKRSSRKAEPNTFSFCGKKSASNNIHGNSFRSQFVNNISHERSLEELIRKVNSSVRRDVWEQQHEKEVQLNFSSIIPSSTIQTEKNSIWCDKSSRNIEQQQQQYKNNSGCQHLQLQSWNTPEKSINEQLHDIANTKSVSNDNQVRSSHAVDKAAIPVCTNCKPPEEPQKWHFSKVKSFPTETTSAVCPSYDYNTNAYATEVKWNKLRSTTKKLESATQLEVNNNTASNCISRSAEKIADTLTKWRSMRRKWALHRHNTAHSRIYQTVQMLPQKQEKSTNNRHYALLSPALPIEEKNLEEEQEKEQQSESYDVEDDIDETVDISSLSESSVESQHSSEHTDEMHLDKKAEDLKHQTSNMQTYGNVHDSKTMSKNATLYSSSVHCDNKEISPTEFTYMREMSTKSNGLSGKKCVNKSRKNSVFSPPIALKQLSCASSNVSSFTTAALSTAIMLSSTHSDEVGEEENSVDNTNNTQQFNEMEDTKKINQSLQPLHQGAEAALYRNVSSCKENVYDTYLEQQKRRAMCFAGNRYAEYENMNIVEGQLVKPLKLTRATFDERVETINEIDAMTCELIKQMTKLLHNLEEGKSRIITNNCNTSNTLNSTLMKINNVNSNTISKYEEQLLLLCREYNIDYLDLTFPPILSSLGVRHSHMEHSELAHSIKTVSQLSSEQLEGKIAQPFAILWCPLSLYDQIGNYINDDSNTLKTHNSSAGKVSYSSLETLIHPCAIRVGKLCDYGVASALAALAESPSSLTQILQLDKWCVNPERQSCEDIVNGIQNSISSSSKISSIESNYTKAINKVDLSVDYKEETTTTKKKRSEEEEELDLPSTLNTSLTYKETAFANSSTHICYVWLCVNGVWDQVDIDLFLPCVINSDATKSNSATLKETNSKMTEHEANNDNGISNSSSNFFYGCSVKAEFIKKVTYQSISSFRDNTLLAKYWPCFIEKALAKVHSSAYVHRQFCNEITVNSWNRSCNDNYGSNIEEGSCTAIIANNHCECDSYQQICKLHAAEVIAMLTGGPIEHWDEWWKHDSALAFDEMESVIYEETGKGRGILLLTTNKHLPSSYTDDTFLIKSLRPETTYRVLSIVQCEQTGEIVASLRIWHEEDECHSSFAQPVASSHKSHKVKSRKYVSPNERYILSDTHVGRERNNGTTMHVTFATNNRASKVKDNFNNNKCEIQDRSSVIELSYSTQILPNFSSCHVCYDCRHFNDIRLPIYFLRSAERLHKTHATSSSASQLATPLHIIRLEIGENIRDKRTGECNPKRDDNDDEIKSAESNRRVHLWIGLYQPSCKHENANSRNKETKQYSILESSLPTFVETNNNNNNKKGNRNSNHCESVVEMKLSLIEDTSQGVQQKSAKHIVSNEISSSYARASTINKSSGAFAEEAEEKRKDKEKGESEGSVLEVHDSNSSECQFYKHHKRYCLLGESFGGAFRAWPSIWLDVEVDCSIPRVVYIIPQLRWSTGKDIAMSYGISKEHDEVMIDDDDSFSAISSRMHFTLSKDDHVNSKKSITNTVIHTNSAVVDDDKNKNNDKSDQVWCSTVALLTEQPEHFHVTQLHSPDELTAAIQHNLLTEVNYHHIESSRSKQRNKLNEHTREQSTQ